MARAMLDVWQGMYGCKPEGQTFQLGRSDLICREMAPGRAVSKKKVVGPALSASGMGQS
jgi:hypothetical protein